MIQGLFGNTTEKGPCPICGAPNATCGGPGPAPEGVAFVERLDLRPDPSKQLPKYMAPHDIIGRDGYGPHEVLLYAKGTGIPVIVALREGVTTLDALTPDERAGLATHLARNPQDLADVRAMAKKKGNKKTKDRMIRAGQVVQK